MVYQGKNYWALILGGSSGFGLASAQALAAQGMNLCLVHRDRRGSQARIDEDFSRLRSQGVNVLAFNLNALAAEGRQNVINGLADQLGQGKIRVLLHSIALGNLKPAAPKVGEFADSSTLLQEDDLHQTVYNMGTSLLSWVQDLMNRRMFAADARVFGLTSEGNTTAWPGYGAVSAAKCALEALARTIAVEFAPHGIRCNVLQPGVTDTPALRLIPGHEGMINKAKMKNPFSRLTTPRDVGDFLELLCRDEARWLNGAVLRIDGGEHISGL